MRSVRRRLAVAAALAPVVALVLPGLAPTAGAHGRSGDDLRALRPPAAASAIKLDRFQLVGHNGLGDLHDYGDVWGHGDYAYVGTRCGDHGRGGAGVKVVSIADPSSPRVVSSLRNPTYSRAEDVVVHHVATGAFTGDLAAVGIQQCFDALDRGNRASYTGIEFFDVTRPVRPVFLAAWKLPRGPERNPVIGCHEIDLVQQAGGRVLAGCARNFVDQAFGNSPGVHFVDVTDPRKPRQVSTFSLPVDPLTGVGCFKAKFDHSVRFTGQGRTAYLSYWDAGTVRLDLDDPARPRRVATVKIAPPDEDGDNHSMTLANGGKWLVINPEDFSPSDGPSCARFDGYGEAHVYDNTHPARPRFLGSFATPNTHSTRTDGAFTVHNTEVVRDRQFFSSWYSDGVVWWTMADSGASYLRGQFVPPSTRFAPPLVWGVYPDARHDVILASDITSGLWIVRPVGLGRF